MAKGKLSSASEAENFGRGYNNNNNNNYNNYNFSTTQKESGENKDLGMDIMRKNFGETLFNDNNPASPNLSNMATISHKQVISSVV